MGRLQTLVLTSRSTSGTSTSLDGWGEPVFYDSDGSHYTVISFGWRGSSNLPYVGGPTSTFDADIVFADGNFLQWPEGLQTN